MKLNAIMLIALTGALVDPAYAHTNHKCFGLGFRGGSVPTANSGGISTTAPIGARYWFGAAQKVGIDLGFGVTAHKDVSHDTNLIGWSIEAGVPLLVTSWDRVHFIFRPGVNYARAQVFANAPPNNAKLNDALLDVTAELEAEVFIVDNVSISASHGFGIASYNPAAAGAKSTTDFTTLGNNFTDLGFHIYLK